MNIQNGHPRKKALFSALLGISTSLVTILNFFQEKSRLIQLALFVLLSASTSAAYYKFIFPRVVISLMAGNKKKLAFYLFTGSLFTIFLVSNINLPMPLDKKVEQRLEIIPLPSLHESSRLVLMEIKVDEKRIPLKTSPISAGWEIQNRILTHNGDEKEGISFAFKNSPQSQVSLLFQEGPQMGAASIVVNGEEQKRINLLRDVMGEQLVTVQAQGIYGGPIWLSTLIKLVYGIALLPFTITLSWIILRPFTRLNLHLRQPAEKPMHRNWLFLLSIEFLLAGILFCWNSLLKIAIHTNYTINVGISNANIFLLTTGIFLLATSIILLLNSKVEVFFRNNNFFSYLIPSHVWALAALLSIELIVRITTANPPLGFVNTNWFGRVYPQGSSFLQLREGYAITHYDGPPGEVHTPYQGGDNVIILGDSFTEGQQVSDRQKFTSIAETILQQDGYNIDIHNLGKGDNAMSDYVKNIYGYQILYDPAIIIVQLSETDFIESFVNKKSSYFVVEDGKIISLFNRDEIKDNYIVDDSISYDFNLMSGELGERKFIEAIGMRNIRKFNQIIGMPIDKTGYIPEAFDINLAGQQMNLLLKACNGTPLIIVTIPHAPYISGNDVIMTNPKHENLKRFLSNYPQLIVVDPLPEFQKLADIGVLPAGFSNSPTPGSGHLNQYGNKILGELLAEKIKEVLK